ncbi:MAG: UDP-N-acetylglucosamine 1-carboxyvinyltransferase [bacterium]
MAKLIVHGGNPLKGTVIPAGNKNSILALIPATILCNAPVKFTNVPSSTSVRIMLEIYSKLGGKVTEIDSKTFELDSTSLDKYTVDETLAIKERASYMFLGPLLKKFGTAEIVDAGGCRLGNRPVDTLFQGLIEMGVVFNQSDTKYSFSVNELTPKPVIWLLEASVTGTENLILTATLCKGKTVIYNAACEPHVQDLCNFINSVGGNIKGVGTNRLEIDGVETLRGGSWNIISDHIDIGGLIVGAAITKGEVLIKNAIPEHMTQILKFFEKLNLKVEIRGDDIFVPSNQDLYAKVNIKGDIDKINDLPWPGFPVDLVPEALTLALAARGSIRIYSTLYENQLMYVEELKKLGAQVIMADPHRVITFGATKFKPGNIVSPEIIQCAYSMFLCCLAANGKSVINNVDSIYRRFPELVEQYASLGAKLEKE